MGLLEALEDCFCQFIENYCIFGNTKHAASLRPEARYRYRVKWIQKMIVLETIGINEASLFP